MKKFKRLNNKGFTLIELLAVIVILAVVMGVATTSVLSAMNNSRKSSLVNSAKTAADAFRSAYAETALNPNVDKILGVSYTAGSELSGALTTDTATALNISENNYDLAHSFVKSTNDGATIVVCMTAKSTGSYYVGSSATTKRPDDSPVTFDSSPTKYMWACSDDTTSWD